MRRIAVTAATAAVFTVASAAPAMAETGTSNGKTYSVTTAPIEGATPDRLGKWDADIATLNGGDPAVVAAVNQAGRTSAQDQINDVKGGVYGGEEWNFESKGQITFRSIAVAQLIIGNLYYGAHPSTYISTVVIDSRSTDPIMLTDLFTDAAAALRRLSDQTGALPEAQNFANWIPTDNGLEIHFSPYQFGIALSETKTVPWSALSDLLAPAMSGITQA
jgi:hypothetical protein